MAELKTKPSGASVKAFLDGIPDAALRRDCRTVAAMMKDVTKAKPRLWGDSIVGFGDYRYKYRSGREGTWFLTGFAPRKNTLTLYLMGGFKSHTDLMRRLGRFKTGGGCLYLKSLDDVDLVVLKKLIRQSVATLRKLSV